MSSRRRSNGVGQCLFYATLCLANVHAWGPRPISLTRPKVRQEVPPASLSSSTTTDFPTLYQNTSGFTSYFWEPQPYVTDDRLVHSSTNFPYANEGILTNYFANISPTVMARLLLIGAAALYGTNFSLVKVMGATLPTGLSSTIRFGLAALVTSPWLLMGSSSDNKSDGVESTANNDYDQAWGAMLAGAEVGLWNSIGYIAQAVGLETTDASVSAFLCSLAVVVVPFLDVAVSGKSLRGRQWMGALLALSGVAFLELGGGGMTSTSVSSGDLVSCLQPLAFGVGFWRLEEAMRKYPSQGRRSTAAQLLAVFLGCVAYTALNEPVSLAETAQHVLGNPQIMALIFYTGIISTALSIYMESVALKTLTASESTLLLSLEPLWGAMWAALLVGEQLGVDTFAGGFLVLAGCLYSSLGGQKLENLLGLKQEDASSTTSVRLNLAASSEETSSSSHKNLRVCVIGGVHGNEYTGIWCIKAMEEPKAKARLKERFPSLNIETLFANPPAHQQNRRFLDVDLNRQFNIEELHSPDNDNSEAWEVQRAQELEAYLGPKTPDAKPAFDVAIDLHSTTTNMGTTLIFPEGDALMSQAATYVTQHMPEARILVEPLPPREYRPNVSSCAKHDFTVEVGPVPQGVLRHDVVIQTQTALEYILEYLQQHVEDAQAARQQLGETKVACFHAALPRPDGHAMTGKIAWPSSKDNENFPAWIVHPNIQDADYRAVRRGDPLFVDSAGRVICYDGSQGEEIYVIFVNEAGYYYESSGTGIGVAYRGKFSWTDGMLVSSTQEPKETSSVSSRREASS